MHSDAADRTGLDRIDGQRAAVEAPPVRCAQILVVVAQVPHQIRSRAISVQRPVVCDTGDASQRVTAVVAGRINLTDDRVLGAGDPRERCQRGPHAGSAVMRAHRVQGSRRIGGPQFCCRGEQFSYIVEPSVVDGGGVKMDQVGDCEPVGDVQRHGSGGPPLLLRMSSRHSLRVWPVCAMQVSTGNASSADTGGSVGSGGGVDVGPGTSPWVSDQMVVPEPGTDAQ